MSLLQGGSDPLVLLQDEVLVPESRVLLVVHDAVVLQRLLQLLHGLAGGVRKPPYQPLCPALPQLYLQEVADVAGVCEEVGVGLVGIVVHVFRALTYRHLITAGVSLSS